MSLKTVNVRIYFHLPPCFIGDFLRGVNEQLNSYLMKYIPELKGVPLSYSNVKIEEKVANVLYDSPFCHLHATCTFTLFAPREGSTIVGIVNKVSSDHIGLLVHGVFNASIAAEHIQKTEYHFNHGAKAWRRVDEDGEPTGEKIAAGSVVKFTIIG
ncbi:DNA-directed RNA polymerase I complex subunit Rpa43 [Obelidium mucronatum]|nr:DNA-directed RNA polymerase I complex subunit Rpa43 [Obelidium mucronatum]